MRLLIHPERDEGLFDREQSFVQSLSDSDVEGSVELFE
jgi:hypothetical protein